MRGVKFILLVAVAMAGLALGTGVGASTGKQRPATKAAAPGIHRTVLRASKANGSRLKPAVVKRLLRSTDSDGITCTGGTKTFTPASGSNPAMQNCDITAASGMCIEQSSSPFVVQTCNVTQPAGTTDNKALILQVIRAQGGVVTQDGTQIANINQRNASAANWASVTQLISQSLGPGSPDDEDESELEPNVSASTVMPINQTQESHQIVNMDQDTNGVPQAGSNFSNLWQSLRQRERASKSPSITQHQNLDDRGTCPAADDTNANQCAVVFQSSTNGKNTSILNEFYRQFQRVLKAQGGEQVQGDIVPFTGGLNHEVHQSSPLGPPESIFTNQIERQVQRAVQSGVTHRQNGPRKGAGSSQFGSAGDMWRGFIGSTQIITDRPTTAAIGTAAAVSAGIQDNILQYFGTSTGNIQASLVAVENNNGNVQTQTTSCNGSTCAAQIVCTNEEGSLTFLRVAAGSCVPTTLEGPPGAPPCPEGQVRNAVTGRCEALPPPTTTIG
jgi:hypothetical protein